MGIDRFKVLRNLCSACAVNYILKNVVRNNLEPLKTPKITFLNILDLI